jgi:hypothetical protein
MLDEQDSEMAAILIRAEYDNEAQVWVAQSDEIPLANRSRYIRNSLPENTNRYPGRVG